MPKSPAIKPSNSQLAADISERFPSLKLWEDPYGNAIDLASVRTQAGKHRHLSKLMSQSVTRYPDLAAERGHLDVSGDTLRELIAVLDLEPTSAEQLLQDTILIADWYLLPQRRAALRFDSQHQVAAMETVARQAHRLYLTVSTDILGLEELLQFLADHGESELDDVDLRQFATTLATFSTIARRAVDAAKPPRSGRKSESRRNQALALLIMATEQATGERVRVSRANEAWRFTTQAGQLIRDVFKLLGWPDERVLVGVVQRISRKPGKTIA